LKRRRNPPSHVHHDRWLVSYADFITLLFAFFVVLYSAAVIDRKKMTQVAASIQVAFQQMGVMPASSSLPATAAPAQPAAPGDSSPPALPPTRHAADGLQALQKELEEVLAPEISRGEVAVHAGPDGLVVSLREVGFFDSGSAGIQAQSRPAFSRMARLLAQHDYQVRIEGHTDNVPIHNSQFSSNWELSTSRATEMVRLLITRYQMKPEQLSAAGYAEYHPAASNESPQGRALNRRVDVVIVGKPATAGPMSPGSAISSP